MKTYLDCIPCFFRQALESARKSGASKKIQKKILNELAKILPEFPLKASPPEMGRIIYKLAVKITGRKDPYSDIKKKSNRLALNIYEKLKKKVNKSKDKIFTAVRLAIAGNIIDYGVKNHLNVAKELTKILREENRSIKQESRLIFNYKNFIRALKKAETILYLGDNAGEIVFDRVLIEEINAMDKNKKITYVVKEKPIINDALLEDAVFCGIDKVARVISSGSDAPGTVLSLCSKNFINQYRKSDMVISKGQGNFEALSEEKRPIFFLFMAKCPVIAESVGCRLGDIVLVSNKK